MPNLDGTPTPEEAYAAQISVTGNPAVDALLERPAPAPGPWTPPVPPPVPLDPVSAELTAQGVNPALGITPTPSATGPDPTTNPYAGALASQALGRDGAPPAPGLVPAAPPEKTPALSVPGLDKWGGAPVPESKPASFSGASIAPPPGMGMFDYTTRNVADIRKGTEALATAEAAKSKFAGEELARQAIDRNAQENFRQQALGEVAAEQDRLRQDILNGKIDPHRLWNSKSDGDRAASLVGILLSGIGSGLTKQPNLALEVINKAIERDINAQTADLGRNENALSSLNQKYGNLQMAQNALRISQGEVYKMKLDAGLAQLGEGVEKAKGMLMSAQAGQALAQMKDQFAQQMGMMRYQMSLMGGMSQGEYGHGSGKNATVPSKFGYEGAAEAKNANQGKTYYLSDGTPMLATDPERAKAAADQIGSLQAAKDLLGRLGEGKYGPLETARATDAARLELARVLGKGQISEGVLSDADNIIGGWKARITPGVDPYSVANDVLRDRLDAVVQTASGVKVPHIRVKGK